MKKLFKTLALAFLVVEIGASIEQRIYKAKQKKKNEKIKTLIGNK